MANPLACCSLVAVMLAAVTASKVFSDVPSGHWAEKHVTFVAVERGFMVGYPDKTFRGQRPFTRSQLVTALDELIDELEALSRTTWVPAAGSAVDGLPADPDTRRRAQRVAGRYGLYDGMPGYRPEAFDGEHHVSRYELAWLIARLLRLGEARGVVDPGVLEPRAFFFTDVPRGDWEGRAEPVVKDVADRYQVMIGFPNGTFRGGERLTRYQFAAAAAQTFPLIRQLVIRTQERKQATPTPAPAPVATAAPRFLEGAMLQGGLLLRPNNVVGLGGFARHAGYAGPWFTLVDAQLGVPVCTSEIYYGGTLGFGYALQAGPSAYVQPFVGGRGVGHAGAQLAGASFGAIASLRPAGPWGYYALAQATMPLWSSTVARPTAMLPQLGGGLSYALTPGLALSLDAGWSQWPTLLGAPTSTDGAANVGAGLILGF